MKTIKKHLYLLFLVIITISCEESEIILETPTINDVTKIDNETYKIAWSKDYCSRMYSVDVAYDADFEYYVTGFKNLYTEKNEILIKDLKPSTDYYIRIAGNRESLKSEYSKTRNIHMITKGLKTLPAKEISKHKFIAYWGAELTNKDFYLDVATDAEFKEILPEYSGLKVEDYQKEVTGLKQGTTYYYRVRLGDNPVSSNTSSVTTTIEVPKIEKVGQVTPNGAKIHWTENNDAHKFVLEVSKSQTFDTIESTYEVTSETNYEIKDLEIKNKYYVRMYTECHGNKSDLSNIVSFDTGKSVTNFQIVLDEIDDKTAKFTYTHPLDYDLTYGKIELFTNKHLHGKTISATIPTPLTKGQSITVTLNGLKANTTYYARANLGYWDHVYSDVIEIKTKRVEKYISKIINTDFEATINYKDVLTGEIVGVTIKRKGENTASTYTFGYDSWGNLNSIINTNDNNDKYDTSRYGTLPYQNSRVKLKFSYSTWSGLKLTDAFDTHSYTVEQIKNNNQVTESKFKYNGNVTHIASYTYTTNTKNPLSYFFNTDFVKLIYYLGLSSDGELSKYYGFNTPLSIISYPYPYLPDNEVLKDEVNNNQESLTYTYLKDSNGDVTKITIRNGSNNLIDETTIQYQINN